MKLSKIPSQCTFFVITDMNNVNHENLFLIKSLFHIIFYMFDFNYKNGFSLDFRLLANCGGKILKKLSWRFMSNVFIFETCLMQKYFKMFVSWFETFLVFWFRDFCEARKCKVIIFVSRYWNFIFHSTMKKIKVKRLMTIKIVIANVVSKTKNCFEHPYIFTFYSLFTFSRERKNKVKSVKNSLKPIFVVRLAHFFPLTFLRW